MRFLRKSGRGSVARFGVALGIGSMVMVRYVKRSNKILQALPGIVWFHSLTTKISLATSIAS